jgi:PII-like signaling protein
MQLHPKKRIEIFVETPLQSRLTALLDRLDVKGYTVLPALAGRGLGGSWSAEGQASIAGGMIAVIVIVDAEKLDAVLEPVFAMLKQQIGVVSVADVMVMRAEHF